jgi:hypothetical protein
MKSQKPTFNVQRSTFNGKKPLNRESGTFLNLIFTVKSAISFWQLAVGFGTSGCCVTFGGFLSFFFDATVLSNNILR